MVTRLPSGRTPHFDNTLQRQKTGSRVATIVLIIAGIGGVLVVGVLLAMMVFFGAIGSDCDKTQAKLYAEAQKAEPDFNKVVIIPGQPTTAASLQKESGDCFDSTPSTSLERTVTVDETAEEALKQLAASLTAQGYTEAHSDATGNANPCDAGGVTYIKTSQPDMTISMDCDDPLDANAPWQPQNVTEVDATLAFPPS